MLGNCQLFRGAFPFRFTFNLCQTTRSDLFAIKSLLNPRTGLSLTRVNWNIELNCASQSFLNFSARGGERERRRKSRNNNCARSWSLRSPFLQTVYFEYYIRFSSVDEMWREKRKYHRTATGSVKREAAKWFGVSTRGSCIDHVPKAGWQPERDGKSLLSWLESVW